MRLRIGALGLLVLGGLAWSGCSDPSGGGPDCKTSGDCEQGELCIQGECQVAGSNNENNANNQQNNGSNNNPNNSAGCEGFDPDPGELVLNEIMAAVPTDPALGDINGDGTRDSSQDEFLEFVNATTGTMRVAGIQIFKGEETTPLTTITTGCLAPNEGLIIFGGGSSLPEVPGSKVEKSAKAMSLRNSGTRMRVVTAEGVTLYDFTFPSASNASVTLNPQLSAGTTYVPHTQLSTVAYSLGACANGAPFSSGCVGGGNNPNNMPNNNPNNASTCPDAPGPGEGRVVINEVLSNVPNDPVLGDVNGDGARDASDDEFIEIVNVSGGMVRIGGMEIHKDGSRKATIATECLPPSGALVVFGGGMPAAGRFGGAAVEKSSSSFGLTNGGGSRVSLFEAGGTTLIAEVTLPSSGPESLVRNPELGATAPLVAHTQLAPGVPYSPGTCARGGLFAQGCEIDANNNPNNDPNNNPNNNGGVCTVAPGASADRIVINEILSNVPNDPVLGDANKDGARDAAQDEFIEIVNTSTELVRVLGMEIHKDGSRKATIATDCLPPGGVLLVFGGGMPMASMFPGAAVERASSTFGLTNGGGSRVTLFEPGGGATIAEVTVPSSGAESLVRDPELSAAAAFVPHTRLAPGVIYSPGTCARGGAFADGCPSGPGDDSMDVGMDVVEDVMMDADMMDVMPDTPIGCQGVAPTSTTLVLNEVLADVPTANGDANGDGVRDASQDEYVELFNVSGQTLDIEGVTVRKDDMIKATLRGCLEPNTGIVIFGGIQNGAALPSYAGMTVLVASSTFQFANGGDTVRVVTAGGTVLTDYTFGSSTGRSWVRQPELDGAGTFTRHDMATGATGPFSPGVCANGMALTTGCQ